MSTFNPYSHWLGIVGKEKPDTYYELLGLKHGESNVAKIAKSADELLAKVQKMRDNDHFPEWNQILTEIQVAKNCLCNPKYKAEYDAKHPAPSATPSAGMQPGMQPQQPGMYPPPGMQPGMYPQPGMQPGMYPQQGMYPQPGMQPGMYPQQGMYPQPGMQPGMYPQQGMYQQPGMYPQPGMQPGMYPQQGMYPQPGMQQGMPVQPQPVTQPVAQPVAQPVVQQPITAQPVAQPLNAPAPAGNTDPIFSASSSTGKGSTKSSSKSSAKKNSGPSATTRNIIAIVGVCIVGFLGYLLYLKNSKTAENNGDAQEIAQSDDIQGNLNADNSANVGNSDAFMAGNMDEIVKAVDADYQVPNFDAVRQSLTELNFIHARNQLLDIEKMSLSPKNKERLGRLQKVVQYSSDFHTQMNDMVLKLTPPVELCDGEYGLVEVKEIEDEDYVDGAEIKVKKTRVVIRINGKNVRFMMSSPKKQGNNLYDILYRHRFAAMTEAGNMNPALGYAVLELITADGDDETALKLLNTVSQKGTDEQKVTVRQIYDEFNINGLGAMTDIAAAEEQAENADSEKVAENAKEAETLEEADTKKETAKATDNEALKETEKAVSEFKIPEAEDADAKGKVSKKSKKRKSADDDDVDAEDDDDTKVADNKVDDDEEDAEAQAAERHKKEWELLTTTVRQDLSWRRLSAVRRNLMQLEKLAQTEEEKDEHYRLTLLTENMELFVSWIAQHMGNFQPGTTVSANGVDVGVVESTQGRLVIRDQGINKTYTTENLNPKLVEWLVVKSLKAADDYVIYGTYLAMDSEGDRAKAKSYWSTAVGKGFDKMTIDLLMKELDVELPDSGRRPTQQMQNARTGRGKVDMMEPQVIPTGDDYEKAFNAVKKEFAKDYAKSDVRSQMKMVAKFMKQAQDSDRDSAQAYVMAEEAHKIALKNGYYENAYEALMIQETRFQRDTYQERMEMITDANPTIRGQSSSTELVDCALKMGMDAVQRKKKIDANRLLGIARKNAKGSQVKRAQSLEQQLNMMK